MRTLLVTVFLLFSIVFISNAQQTNTDSTSAGDSVVYVDDTVFENQVIEHFIYGPPLKYDAIGTQVNYGKAFFAPFNLKVKGETTNLEVFCDFSRNRLFIETGIGYGRTSISFDNEVQAKEAFTYSYTKTDTITWFGQVAGGDTTITYITRDKAYSRDSSRIIKTDTTLHNAYTSFEIPLTVGYYLKQGFLSTSIGVGLTGRLSRGSSSNNLIINDKSSVYPETNHASKVSLGVHVMLEVKYLISTFLFVHGRLYYEAFPFFYKKNINDNRLIENSLSASVGLSVIFFDKKRE